MATNIYEVKFFTNEWFLDTYKTAFADEFVALTDEEKARFIELASTRIKRIADRPFIDLNDLEQEQAAGAQKAAARIFDYWLEYGLDLNRVSGSVSMGSFSASQTAPNDPDYIPENVYEVLQDVGLYTPVGYLIEKDLRRIDDESAITYGVRFKGLERVKDVSLLKTQDEQNNKELVVPTWNTVSTAIASQIAGNRGFRGLFTTTNLDNVLTEFDTYLNSLITNPVNGDTADLKYLENGSLYNELVENYLYEGAWVKVSQNYDEKAAIVAINDEFQDLKNNAITLDTGNLKYLKLDGTNTMSDTYVPSQPKNVITLDYLNTQLVAKQNQITVNANKNALQDTRLDNLELKVNPLETRLVSIETKNTEQDTRLTATEIKANNAEISASDYAANKADFVRVSDIASSIINTVDIALTESGNNVVATLPVAATAGMTNGKLVRMKLIRTNVSPNRVNYLEDDLDNNSITQNTLALEGTSYECSATLEVATLTISGLAQAQRTVLVGNYRLVQLEQTSSQAGAAIDATARQAAAAADTKAVAAQTDATYAKTKVDAIDLTPITTELANTKATADSALAKSNANESKIGTTALTTTAQTMSGAIEEVNGAYKAADTSLHTTITQEVDDAYVAKSKIKYYTGQIAIFNVEKVAPSKFADTTLFDKYEVPLGAALLGGNTKKVVNGSVGAHKHIGGDAKSEPQTNRKFGVWSISGQKISGNAASDGTGYSYTSKNLNVLVGGTDANQVPDNEPNKAYGLQIISHIYVAKKDITFAEMGE